MTRRWPRSAGIRAAYTDNRTGPDLAVLALWGYVRDMAEVASGGTCQICVMNPKFTHSVNEHALSLALIDPLLEYVKTDAFSRGDRPLTYAAVRERFDVDTTVRRIGRVLDGVERILLTRDWPEIAAAGITAYVVNGGSGQPGANWVEVWHMRPEDARRQARAYVRYLTLGPEEKDES